MQKWSNILQKKRSEIYGLLEDTLNIVGVLRSIEEKRALKTAGISITNQENLSVLSTTMRDIIVQNYIQMLKKLDTNCDYEEIINENLEMTSNVLLSSGVICYNEEYKGLYGGIHLIEKSPVVLADKIKHQMSEIKIQIKDSDFVWINEVLKTLVSQKAVFNNRLFKDIYDFCEAEGFISETQLKLHDSNTQPTARINFIRATYNRLKTTRAYAALINRN